jgi:energy-coupling factor transporter transmembrane protein EcfT
MKQYPPQWAPPARGATGYKPTYYPQDRRRFRDPALLAVVVVIAALIATAVLVWARH